jgi:hypothetical protein
MQPKRITKGREVLHAWLRAGDLILNEDVNGREHPATIRMLTGDWQGKVDSDGKCHLPAALVVAENDDTTKEILDGRHRWTVAITFHGPDVLLLCEIHGGLSDAEKCAMYLRINATHHRDQFDLFDKEAQAGQLFPRFAAATEIRDTLAGLGLHIGKRGQAGTWLSCPSNLKIVHNLGGSALVHDTATVAMAIWPNDDLRFEGRIFEGLARVLAKYPELDRDALTGKVGKYTARNVIGYARGLRDTGFESPVFGKSVPALIAVKICQIYNAGRRTRRLGG